MPDLPTPTPKPAAAKPSVTGPKPKPRAGVVRKTKAEREQFAKEEAERQKARLAEEAKNERARGGARGGRGGARGGRGGSSTGQRDERARDGPISVGSGVFGAGSGLKPGGRPRGLLAEGYSEMLDGQPGIKFDESQAGTVELAGSSGGGRGAGSRRTEAFDIPSDEEADEPKRDIEKICISSGEEDEGAVSKKGKAKAIRRAPRTGTGLRPVRAPRIRREDEEDASASGRRQGLVKKNEPDFHEPDEDEMDVDEPVVVKEQLSSPELRKRSLRKSSNKAREAKLATETIEERAERLRVSDDTHKLRNLFVAQQIKPQATADDSDVEESGIEDGKFFLFQLPPLTPFLLDADAIVQEPAIKAEPTSDTIATVPQSSTVTEANASGGVEVKKDPDLDGAGTIPKPILEMDGLLTATEPTRLPSGLVGKLRLHQSGKVSLDWGGTDMEVRYGSEVDFLQDVVLVKPGVKTEGQGENENVTATDGDRSDAHKDRAGAAYALGHVRKKLVLIPDWAKLYD
ncbi:hypothetical protein A1O3_05206 [Capronia epimyces CBS 606.96]|uniref:DNA-directed RNA polymerase III subunit RPC4 n=1 Tax=Capronia epimyces CBS 606.96 TaxID=1182542 RepID=W9XVF3_9EURO|nr:uncharacterized protein A1O3_05206 [Capronia epimyces CBS 606.96]EXJ84537.1 hypothetical protein A1O3_05206 [Capronia epimyces CBS 606.96]